MKDEKGLKLLEVTGSMPNPEPAPDCKFCSLLCRTQDGKELYDSPSLNFMTEREIGILAAMRRLKEEGSRIKTSLRQMEEQGKTEDASGLRARLKDLRAEWRQKDIERMDAAEERMRLLGHIQ